MSEKQCKECGCYDSHKKNGTKNGKQQYRCKICGSQSNPIILDEDLIVDNVRLAKKTQKLQDINRIERKSFREHARVENAIEVYIKELRDVFSKLELRGTSTIQWDSKCVGIVHLSDLHLNELVDIVGNHYDYKVAGKRLKMFAGKIINEFTSKKISSIYVVMTGDLLNSDRRLDELLSMATNRANATFLAVKLLSQFLIELSVYFNISVISVTGNESRIREDMGFVDHLATDNFDFIIYEILRTLFVNHSGINFISGNTFEYILQIQNVNILIMHGHNLGKMGHTDLSKAISKWGKKGVGIDYIMCGHLHETSINDTLLRASGLVGNNAYSDVALNLNGRASQNYYVVYENGTLDATRVDLQNVDEVEGYDIDETLDAYNAKSIDKIKNQTPVFQVVI